MSFSVRDAWWSLQYEIGEWAEKTFPKATPETILAHLRREIEELAAKGDEDELADCLLLLMHYAHKKKLHSYQAILDKFAVNKARKWGKPDAEGVVEHVR